MKQILAILLTFTSIVSFANNRINTSKIHARIESAKPLISQQATILIAKTINSTSAAAINASKINLIAKQKAMLIA